MSTSPSSGPSPATRPCVRLDLSILAQPDDRTCGPTCLHAVYGYFGDDLPIGRVIDEVEELETGGTLAVLLGCHALRRGYEATIHTANLIVFDPTWFSDPTVDVREKLHAQSRVKQDPKLRYATRGYLTFLELGGELRYAEFGPTLLTEPLRCGLPVLTGLSATHLYRCAREVDVSGRSVYNDIAGDAVGHFVVLSGYDPETEEIWIADPLHENPAFGSPLYAMPAQRVLASILLGALTYDANLLILTPGGTRPPQPCLPS